MLIAPGAVLDKFLIDSLSPAELLYFCSLCGRFGLQIIDAGDCYKLV